MEDVKGIMKVRSDVIGEMEGTDKLIGYKAEMWLKKVLKENEEFLVKYLCEKYDLVESTYYLLDEYKTKYKKYLQDREARIHILEKYGTKQTLLEVVCSRVTDLSAQDCLRIKEKFESGCSLKKLVDLITVNYASELKLILQNDTKKKENV